MNVSCDLPKTEYMYEHVNSRSFYTGGACIVYAAELRLRPQRNLVSNLGYLTFACNMGSHWNVSFEPVSSVFIGSVHDRMTEVVALGSGGFAVDLHACWYVVVCIAGAMQY